jgi:SM-20-related protein
LFPGRGTGYVRHRDAFSGSINRKITAICYLNPGWPADAGGALRLFLPDGPVDVLPELDRLVVFFSEEIEHEVAPTSEDRWALTTWYRKNDPRFPAL